MRIPAATGQPVLDQQFDDESLYALRSAVAAHGSQAGLAEGRLGDLVLVVHELAANAIQHGAGRGRLRIWNTGTELRCEVADDGINHGSGGDAEADRRDPAHWSIEPGHGLWVSRQVADRASLNGSSSGTVAVAAFTLGPPGVLPPFRLTRQLRDDCVVLSVTGQLDLGSAQQLTRTIDGLPADGTPACLVLDLAALTGWDSCGLAALITAQQLADDRPGGRMIVAGLPGSPQAAPARCRSAPPVHPGRERRRRYRDVQLLTRAAPVPVSGVYGGEADPMPMMEMFDRGIQLRMGQAHVKRWIDDLMPLVSDGSDPLGVTSFATHHLPFERAPHGYEIFRNKEDGCIKVVLQP